MQSKVHYQWVTGGTLAVAEYGAVEAPTVVILGGISGHRDILLPNGAGWWQGLAAELPLTKYRLLAVDYAGGPGESQVSPLPITVQQQAELVAEAVMPLLAGRTCAVMGGSYGGLLAFELSRYDWVQQLVVLAAAHRPTAWAVAYRSFQRTLFQLAESHPPGASLAQTPAALARSMAMLSYRSLTALDQYYPDPAQLLAYLDRKGTELSESWPAASRAFVTHFGPALDQYQIEPGKLTTPMLSISFTSDQLVPPLVMAELHAQAPGSRAHFKLESSYGHDGFIKETAAYGPLVREFFQEAG